MPLTVAVTGATGYVGRFVVAELQRQGVTVRALARPASNRTGFSQPLVWMEGNLHSDQQLAAFVQGVDAVVHLAYEHVPGRYRGGEGTDLKTWLDANLTGTLRLLIAAQGATVPKFIFLSSRAVFSRTEPGRGLDETHPLSPDTHYGAYKAAVEAFLSSFAHGQGMQTHALRATGVYGLTWPVDRSKWWDLITAVLDGDSPMTIRGGTEIHGQDVAQVVWALISQSHPQLPVIHLSDLVITTRDVVALTRQMTDMAGPLPAAPPAAPRNVLVCDRISDLGLSFGGRPLWEQTITDLIQTAQSR